MIVLTNSAAYTERFELLRLIHKVIALTCMLYINTAREKREEEEAVLSWGDFVTHKLIVKTFTTVEIYF